MIEAAMIRNCLIYGGWQPVTGSSNYSNIVLYMYTEYVLLAVS